MEPTPELTQQLWREKVKAASEMLPAEKLLAGPKLFDDLVRLMVAGIRAQTPGASEAEVMRQLDRRLEIAERLEGRQ